MSEDDGQILATDEIPLFATERQIWEILAVSIRVVFLEPREEKLEKLQLFEARGEILHSSIIHEELETN